MYNLSLDVFYMGPYGGASGAGRPKNGASRLRSYTGSTTHDLPAVVQTADGSLVDTPGEVLKAWKEYFCNLLNPKTTLL